jgi:GNAT superfamily N-acetyltransferase
MNAPPKCNALLPPSPTHVTPPTHCAARWFCLAAIASSGGPGAAAGQLQQQQERVIGFAAAALGRVGEFALEQAHLSSVLKQQQQQQQQLVSRAEATTTLPAPPAAPSGTQQASAAVNANSSEALALEVVLLGVLPGFRRQGVASRLLQAMKRHARAQG